MKTYLFAYNMLVHPLGTSGSVPSSEIQDGRVIAKAFQA